MTQEFVVGIRIILKKVNSLYQIFQEVGLKINLSKTEATIWNKNKSHDCTYSEFIKYILNVKTKPNTL